jgi:predicted phosphodiesterase
MNVLGATAGATRRSLHREGGGVGVFAVEDTAIELCWPGLAAGTHVVEVGGRRREIEGADAPAALWIDELPPDTELDVVVDGRRAARARTLAPPPGRLLARVATVSDLHVGDGWTFGVLPKVHDAGGPDDPIVLRCARAALAEIAAWAPDLVVVKGDVTHHGRVEEWELAASLLAETGLPVIATVGNHDVKSGPATGARALDAHGIELVTQGVATRDLPGLRVIVADASVPQRHHGTFDRVGDDILGALAAAPTPALVAVHHQLHPIPVLTHWPPGILGGGRFTRAIAEANPDTLVTSGHTHRHRARREGPVVITEVGSPKDHPGTWAGYAVHEGGIRQVVRRIADPRVLAWTEATKQALFGIWGRWSPGTLEERCFGHTWPGR